MNEFDVVDEAAKHLVKRGRDALALAEEDGRLERLIASTSQHAVAAAGRDAATKGVWRWLGGAGLSAIVVVGGATYVSTRSSSSSAGYPAATPTMSGLVPTASASPPPPSTVLAETSFGVSVDALPTAPSSPFARAAGKPATSAEVIAPTASEAAAESASSLFQRANAARHRADDAAAEALYRELLERYPGTREAITSRVIAGRMMLARGEAAKGLALFDAYLAESPMGTLSEQALVGRAHCLRRLGQRSDERAAWRALLAAFPQSANRAEALEALGAP
jgi:Tetratricopeptide repeat